MSDSFAAHIYVPMSDGNQQRSAYGLRQTQLLKDLSTIFQELRLKKSEPEPILHTLHLSSTWICSEVATVR